MTSCSKFSVNIEWQQIYNEYISEEPIINWFEPTAEQANQVVITAGLYQQNFFGQFSKNIACGHTEMQTRLLMYLQPNTLQMIFFRDCILEIWFFTSVYRFALSKLHPLLGYATGLEGTETIRSSITPYHMHLPAEMMTLQLEPLKVTFHFITFQIVVNVVYICIWDPKYWTYRNTHEIFSQWWSRELLVTSWPD